LSKPAVQAVGPKKMNVVMMCRRLSLFVAMGMIVVVVVSASNPEPTLLDTYIHIYNILFRKSSFCRYVYIC
jgi:hypothetical protein